MWNFDNVLRHDLVTVLSRDDARETFKVQISSLRTPITLAIEVSAETGYVRCVQSHMLVTPLPHRTKRPGTELRDIRTFDPGFAVSHVLDLMTKEYRVAMAAGHIPDEGWLVGDAADRSAQ